jgi:predicted amidohydrolase
MKAAMIVPRISSDLKANAERIEEMVAIAAGLGCSLVLLPEAVLTGLINNDDPAHDLPLGRMVPGPALAKFTKSARRYNLWIGLGLLERDGGCLYDSAVLIAPDKSIALKYRRNQPQWHGRAADPTVYKQGTSVNVAQTPFGTVGFLICGDLFDDEIVTRFRDTNPDLLLFPFARCFPGGAVDQTRWDKVELPKYISRLKLLGTPALMVNYIGHKSIEDSPCFGGAFAISADGEVLAALSLGVQGIKIVDLDKLLRK